MSNRPVGKCRLCLQRRQLCRSHLLPAGVFRTLRATRRKNPNPALLTDSHRIVTSKQPQDYLLCDDCEQRFSSRGEKWVLNNCYRANGDFKIREALLRTKPVYQREGNFVFAGANAPEIDMNSLTYFGLSVFWRATVITWQQQTGPVHIDLGPYEEPLRLFLLDQVPFPDKMTYSVRVSSLRDVLQSCLLPCSENHGGYHIHQFSIPGVVFGLLVGTAIPAEHFRSCSVRSPERFIAIIPEVDIVNLRDIAEKSRKAKARERLL